MKVVILAGGYGSRISEETTKKPKPMIKIGNKTMIDNIMEIYQRHGFNEFIIAGGYKYKIIEKYFKRNVKVKVINTGLNSQTGKRILKLKKYLNNEDFLMTYGDGLANIEIDKLLKLYLKKKPLCVMTVVRPPARWGAVKLKNEKIVKFEEKNQINEGWINGGFFVFNKEIFNRFNINEKNYVLETDLLPKLSETNQLFAYKHRGFWQCMDTLRDKIILEKLSLKKIPPWKK